MHGKRAVTYIRLQQCTCCNHHDHHRHHKQKRISTRSQTRSASPYSNAAHSQPHQIINHVSNTYSCKSQIHERREVSSRIPNNMAQHRHRMPNTDKNIRAAAATIPRIKLKNPSSKPTITQQPNGKKQYHHCTRFANNTVIMPFVSLS